MKRIFFILVILLFGIIAWSAEIDSIEKSHEKKIESVRKRYQAEIDKVNAVTIKRYETLKKKLTRAGKLEEAVEVLNRIKRLKGEKVKTDDDDDEELEDIDDDDNDGMPNAPPEIGTESDRQARKKLKKRYLEFHIALGDNDIDKAIKYVDPKIMPNDAARGIIRGFLQTLAGWYQVHRLKGKNSFDINVVYFANRRKYAKVIGQVRSGFGKWHDTDDPQYWIKKKGEWFLGDKDTLKKKKFEKK